MLDNFLRVKKSTIPQAGKGVFTKSNIKKGQIVTELVGPLLNHKEYLNLSDMEQNYTFYINRNNILNSYPIKKQFARYVNDANGSSKSKVKNNTEFLVKGKRVFIVAVKNIKKDSELFVDYGEDYWK
jgi:SET domain-containing protein